MRSFQTKRERGAAGGQVKKEKGLQRIKLGYTMVSENRLIDEQTKGEIFPFKQKRKTIGEPNCD